MLDHVFTEPVWDDFLVPGLSLGNGASAPTLKTFRDGIQQAAFSGSGPLEEGFFEIHMLHGLRAASPVSFHIHWAHIIGAPTGDVKWNIECSFARGYEAGTFPSSTTLSTVQTAGAQYAHHITDDDDMVIGPSVELEPDSVIIGRVYRDSSDAEDTFANDAFLLHVDIHYQRTSIGTLERNRVFSSTGYS